MRIHGAVVCSALVCTVAALPCVALADTGDSATQERSTAIYANVGWNSLVGVGPMLSHRVNDRFALDAGVGFSGRGLTASGLGRVFFYHHGNWSEYFGLGVTGASGMKDFETQTEDDRDVTYDVASGAYFPVTIGAELSGESRFRFLAGLGLAFQAGGKVTCTAGACSDKDSLEAQQVFSGGGLVVELGFGYAW